MEQLQTENNAAGGLSDLTDVLERMRARADNAYCDYYAALAAGKNARAARDLAFLTIEEALGMSPNR